MTNQLSTPSLEISRPVLTHAQFDFDAFKDMVKEMGFSGREVRIYAKESDRIQIVPVSEVRSFLQSVGVEVTATTVNELADYLDVELDDGFDQLLEAEILPYSFRDTHDSSNSMLFTVGGELSERVLQERELAKKAIQGFVGTQPGVFDWKLPAMVSDVMLARLFATERAPEFRSILGSFLGMSAVKIVVGGVEVIDTLTQQEVESLGTTGKVLDLPTHLQIRALHNTKSRTS